MSGKRFLICFTGVDGSGKTTHAKALMSKLRNKGYNCKYIWGASRPFLSFAFFALTKLLGYWKETKKDTYTDPLEFAPRNTAKRLARLYHFLLFVDLQIKTTIKIRVPMVLGKTIICDRYFYDLLMDLHVTDTHSANFDYVISRTLPSPLVTFLLDAPVSLTSQRRGFSIEELKTKKEQFMRMAQSFHFFTVNSSEDFNTNQKIIQTVTLRAIG